MENIPQAKYSKEKLEEISKKFGDFMYSLSEEKYDAVQDEIVWKALDLKDKYQNALAYAMYHVLTGSTIHEESVPIEYEDFRGEDSVELFIDNLINQR